MSTHFGSLGVFVRAYAYILHPMGWTASVLLMTGSALTI
jgi:hypothetical protein